MDKLLHNNWFVKIISFVTAMMLYAIVTAGNGQPPAPSDVSKTADGSQQTTMSVKLDARYDSDRYVISGAPERVNLRLTGSNDLILKARPLAGKSAFIDMTGMKPGTYDVQIQTKGFPGGLKVTPVPRKVRVTLQEKTSKEMPVSVDILNKDSIGEDYQIGDPVIDQQRVTITGGKETVDSIAFVRGVVNLKGADSTVDKMISLHAYDNSGSQVNTDISPSSVHVRVPITRVSKQLDIQGITTGKPADGYSVSSLELSEKQATVFAEDGDALNEITAIEPLSVSVDGLKEDRTVNVNVPVPPGATKVTPKTVKVTVHIVPSEKPASGQDGDSSSSSSGASSSGSSGSSSDSSGSSSSSGQSEASTETRKFSSVPVTAANLSDNRRATLDHNSAVDVSVTGKASDMDRLDRDDIRAEVDLKGLDTGDHQVQVSVAVPEGMTAVSNPGKLKVTIS